MAISMARSGLRAAVSTALLGGTSTKTPLRSPGNKRSFGASRHHDDAYEAQKWEKITLAGIVTCTILAIYNLSKGHPHYPDPPPYPYLHIHYKDYPWGPDPLFEHLKKKKMMKNEQHSE